MLSIEPVERPIVGGYDAGLTQTRSVDVYDPENGTWEATQQRQIREEWKDVEATVTAANKND